MSLAAFGAQVERFSPVGRRARPTIAAMTTHPLLGVALVLAAASLRGTTSTAQALSGQALPATWFGALRLAVAALFFAAYAAWTLPRGWRNGAALPKGHDHIHHSSRSWPWRHARRSE